MKIEDKVGKADRYVKVGVLIRQLFPLKSGRL